MSSQPSTHSPQSLLQSGALYAVLAYTSWGLLPIYWKLFGQVPALEVLSHRILWSMIFLFGLLLVGRRFEEFANVWRSPQHIGILLLTATILAFNWGLYIYGVNTNRVVETSLGYYINPLVNVLLGFVFLKERLNRVQIVAVGLATIGVVNFIWRMGTVPWIALVLAFSFGFYGLLRKSTPIAPMVGLTVETLLITPMAAVLMSYWAISGTSHWGQNGWLTTLFIGCGVLTSMPLLWFNAAAKRLRLSTIGFFQYLSPSLQLLLGVFLYQYGSVSIRVQIWRCRKLYSFINLFLIIENSHGLDSLTEPYWFLYHEPFTLNHTITFGLVWTAILLYSASSLLMHRAKTSA